MKNQLGQSERRFSAFRRLPNSQIGNNLRVRKTDGAGNVTNYLYDGLQVLAETDGTGSVKKLFNPGVSLTDDEGNKYFMLHNGHGDVEALVDRDGNIVDTYSYDAFGKTIGVDRNSNGYRYVGLGNVFSDDDIGLQYMWNRWYDPGLGRFISRDSIGFSGGNNLYRYAENNPLSYIDPLGLWAVGYSLQYSNINPFTSTGGGVYGLNLEYTSTSGWGLYKYYTPRQQESIGFSPGFSFTGNLAMGDGSWTGTFESGEGGYGLASFGYFNSPLYDSSDYFGLDGGISFGLPGVGFTRTEYSQLFKNQSDIGAGGCW